MFVRFSVPAVFALTLSFLCSVGISHPADENPDLTLPDTTRNFRQDRFGMFIHWGLYSGLCDGEGVMKDQNIPVADYERLAQFFNPADFNAEHWVSLAKAAGMRYITLTAKSRDGFPMWNSRANEWNVVKSTPFARDVVKELADECRRQGIKLFLSYSPRDWYQSELLDSEANTRSDARSPDVFTTASLAYTQAQISELLTDYGKIDGVWLNGWWDHSEAGTHLEGVYNLIHKLQPAALVGIQGGGLQETAADFKAYRRELPRGTSSETTVTLEYSKQPLEITETINESWGYRLTDHQYKSTRDLIHQLAKAAGADANLLLSVGPMPNGQIQPEFQERLRRVGMWLAKNGDSIYSTRGGPIKPQPWGVTTHRGRKVYVHVLDEETTSIALQLPSPLRSARYYSDESDVVFEDNGGTVVLTLRPERRGEMERLLLLETRAYN